jgi:hypothetical protein
MHTLGFGHKKSSPPPSSTSINSPVVPSPTTKPDTTVASLMDQFTKAWNPETKDFAFLDNFDLTRFTKLLSDHVKQFAKKDIDYRQHFGYIEKFDLDPAQNPEVYMRADLHGDLKSLIENLRSLQEQGLLDAAFKCNPGVHLVFLGDYCDRGSYGTQILEMLMCLREENPQQVHLIRGNHEYDSINYQYKGKDNRLVKTLKDSTAREALQHFYETMSLTTYFSVGGVAVREYIQSTHGTFEPTMDPAPLLDQEASEAYLAVPKERKLSERIQKITKGNSVLAESARRVANIAANSQFLEEHLTVYNWGDVQKEGNDSLHLTIKGRLYAFSTRDIRHYLKLSSDHHRVMMLFRGHQHDFQHLMDEDRVLITTLPVGVDCPYYDRFDQPDRAYIIKPAAQVADWQKRAILRAKLQPSTDQITSSYPLISSVI